MASETTEILHVDDDAGILDLTKQFLEREREEFVVRTATRASDALDIIEEDDIECVVSDHEMPGLDGIEFLDRVREEHDDLPFILYTGRGSEAVASDAISAGVTDYLQKETGTSQYQVLANRIANVVEQYRVKRSVESTEEKLSLVAEKTDDILFMVDAEWSELLFVNRSYEEIWGGSTEELGNDPTAFLEYIHPDDRDVARRSMTKLSAGDPHDVTYRVLPEDGGQRWVRGKSKPVFDEGGNVDRIVGFVRDITEQRERERELERIKRQYGAVFHDPNILVGLLAPDGTVRDINDTAMEYIDCDLAAVLGEPFWETPWWGSDDELRRDVKEWVERAATGEYVDFEADIAGPGGTRIVSGGFQPVTTEDGTVESIIVSDRDISERVARDEELERLWDRVEFLLGATDSGIWEWDGEADSFQRHGVARLFDFSSGEYDGAPPLDAFFDRIHPDDRDRVRESFDRLRTDRTSHRIEYRVPTEDGVRWFEDHAHTRTDADTPSEIIGLLTDITDRKQRERAIEDLHRTAQDVWNARSPDAVAELIVEAARDILDMPANGVHLYDESAGRLQPAAVTDRVRELLDDVPEFEPGDGLAWEVFESGDPQIHDDVSTVSGRYSRETPFRGELILPLSDHGVFQVGTTEPESFDATDVSLMRILAAHASSALDQLERERRLTALQRRTPTLMHTPTREETCQVAVDAAYEILESPASCVHLVTDDGTALEPVAFVDAVREDFQPPTYEQDGGGSPFSSRIWDAFESGSPVVIEDTHGHLGAAESMPIRSALIYPLADEGVFIVNETEVNAFDATDEAFIEILSTSLATALGRVEREVHLQERERILERQNERLEDFASIVSHDLRNPLTVASGRVELAREDCDSEHLERAATALERSQTLIDDLLALAREGGTVQELQSVELRSAAEDSWKAVETGNARLVIESDSSIEADRGRLRQLLENLIRNAIEHGGGDVTITLGDLPDGFFVADDGQGIPVEDRTSVFEVGYSTADDGIGFGLTIVDEIGEAHGWDLDVTESDTGGARFEISDVEFV